MCQISEGERVLAIDPGRDKVGLAVVERSGDGGRHRTLAKEVVKTLEIETALCALSRLYRPLRIVLGDRTFSREIRVKALSLGIPVSTVDEHMTSVLARKRYFEENRPRGVRGFIPTGMQTPPVPIDDYVAVILGERYIIDHSR